MQKHSAEVRLMVDKKTSIEAPDYVIELFARSLLPAIRKYFDSAEGQREYSQWQAEKEREESRGNNGD